MPELRALRPGDEADICRLFELCHRRALPLDVWRWRYAARPQGFPVLTVAVDKGRIVGHVGALPVVLRRGDERLKAGLWVDLMVAPSYRNLSLFLDIAEQNRAACSQAGWDALFAFPNDNSFPILKRMLEWRDLGDIRALEGPLPRVRRGPGRAQYVERFDDGIADVWRRARPVDRWRPERSAESLTWRYRGRPGARYPAWSLREAFIVAKIFDGPRGRIGDILELWGDDGAQDVLDAALAHFAAERVDIVSAWALPGTPQEAMLSARGLSVGDDVTHFAGRFTGGRGGFPARSDDWCVSKGDSDVF